MHRSLTAALALLVTLAPVASAGGTQTVQGHVIAGGPPGMEAATIALDQIATGQETVTLTWTSGIGTANLDVRFRTASGSLLAHTACATNSHPEQCRAPVGAAYAVIVAISGANIEYTFTYEY